MLGKININICLLYGWAICFEILNFSVQAICVSIALYQPVTLIAHF